MKRTRLNPINRERKKRLYERNFGDYADTIRSMRCVGCGAHRTEAAHSVARGMGGCGGDKSSLVPLCRTCHRLYDTDIDAFKARTWLDRLSVRAIAAELWRSYGTPVEEAK